MNQAGARQARPPVALGAGLLLLMALVTALDAMAIDMYLPAFPAVGEAFAATPAQVQHTLAIFLAGLAVGQGLCGPLLDRYGRRPPLLAGVGLFVLGSVLAALAPSMGWLMAARFLQALGAAVGLVAPRAIVTDCCDRSTSARVFALLMQVMMLGPVIAPVLGSFVLAHSGWRAIFWTLAAIATAALAWTWRALPETLAPQRRASLSLAAVARAYAEQGRNRPFMAYVLAGGFVLGALFVYIGTSPFVLVSHFGLTPEQFSYVFAANAVGLIAGGQLGLGLLPRLGERRTVLAALAVHAGAGLALWLLLRAGMDSVVGYLALVALAVWSLGLVFGNLTALTMEQAGPGAGVASALMGALQYLMGAGIGLAVGGMGQAVTALPLTLAVCGALALACCAWASRVAQPSFLRTRP